MKAKFLTIAISVLITGGSVFAQENNRTTKSSTSVEKADKTNQGNDESLNAIMKASQQQMMNVKITGDADVDFAMLMREHHKGAVKMGHLEAKKGKNDKLVELAQKIADESQMEIKEFDQYLSTNKAVNKTEFGKKQMEMASKSMMDVKDEGNYDEQFAMIMIAHHKDGIAMAEQYLNEGKSEELIKIAKNIIETQTREIEQMSSMHLHDHN
jgi:uncharacterized protein (DUF305 family)